MLRHIGHGPRYLYVRLNLEYRDEKENLPLGSRTD